MIIPDRVALLATADVSFATSAAMLFVIGTDVPRPVRAGLMVRHGPPPSLFGLSFGLVFLSTQRFRMSRGAHASVPRRRLHSGVSLRRGYSANIS